MEIIHEMVKSNTGDIVKNIPDKQWLKKNM